MLPIPGRDALAVTWMATILGIASNADVSVLGTALLLYRLVTWILPMPVGGITFLLWRMRVRRDEAATGPAVETDCEPTAGLRQSQGSS